MATSTEIVALQGGDLTFKTAPSAWQLAQAAAFALVLGTAIQLFRGGAFSAFLHMQGVFTPAALKLADHGLGILLVLLAAVAMFKRFQLAWLMVAFILFLYSLTTFNTAGKWHAEWHLVSAVSRAIFPAFLFWWGRKEVSQVQMRRAFSCLLAVVFFSHGTLAALQTPDFIDYVIGSVYQLSAQYVEEGHVRLALYVVALLDFITAILLLLRPKVWVLAWAFVWILLTLCMRLLTGGWMNYIEVLVRLPYLYMPWFLWRTTARVKAG
jgi:hypothetical protein